MWVRWREGRQESLGKSFKSDEKQLFAFGIIKFLFFVACGFKRLEVCGKHFADSLTLEDGRREGVGRLRGGAAFPVTWFSVNTRMYTKSETLPADEELIKSRASSQSRSVRAEIRSD